MPSEFFILQKIYLDLSIEYFYLALRFYYKLYNNFVVSVHFHSPATCIPTL